MYLGENCKRLNISATQWSRHCVIYTIILIIREGKMEVRVERHMRRESLSQTCVVQHFLIPLVEKIRCFKICQKCTFPYGKKEMYETVYNRTKAYINVYNWISKHWFLDNFIRFNTF